MRGLVAALFILLPLCGLTSRAVQAETLFELETALVMAYSAEAGNMDQTDLVLQPKTQFNLGNRSEVVLSGRLRWSQVDDLDGDMRQLETYAEVSKPWQDGRLSAELRDAYVERSIGNGHLRLGKQQIVWGALDGLKLLDVINPQDFRQFILDEFAESRISQWALHLEWPLAGGYLELAVVPDTSVHELPAADAKFAFSARRLRFGLPTSAGQATVAQRLERNRDALDDGTYGLRYNRFSGGWDWALTLSHGPDHSPVGQFVFEANGQRILERQHRQRSLAGLSVEKSFGSIALRTELAVRANRAFNRLSHNTANPLEVVRREQVSAALAMDWQAPLDLFINIQLLYEQILNYDEGFATPESDTLSTLLVRRNFRYDTLSAELRWYGNYADGDGLVRPSLRYQLGDNAEVRLGADLFYGSANGLFGQFARQDQITLSLSRTF